jgi:hypothetical protein
MKGVEENMKSPYLVTFIDEFGFRNQAIVWGYTIEHALTKVDFCDRKNVTSISLNWRDDNGNLTGYGREA